MFMIVIHHILLHGGVLSSSSDANYAVAWLMNISVYCAVNCYAIISGFVGYSDQPKSYHYKKFLSFWMQVFTYSFGITLIAYLIKPEAIGLKTLIKSLAPVASKQYWYFSAYAGLFFIVPWINRLLQSFTTQETFKFVFSLLTVFVCYVTFANRLGDCFSLSSGYSFVWLAILYIIGAWMKKCNVQRYCKSRTLIIGIFVCVLFAWAAKVFLDCDIFYKYTSFTLVFIAFALVSIFSKLQPKVLCRKFVTCFSPAAFGVYLIHDQQLMRGHFITDSFTWIAESAWWLLIIQVLLSALCIFACCLSIEKCRLLIFRRLKIDDLINKIADMIDNFMRKLYTHCINKLN
jgi:surface polysaccharide O-acyltransferase-like enzyme